ncbi:MAG: glutamate-5-semialdehyde dehydrogenase [Candidatus Gastranaerophilales bacterium]|nr:glutamate-5-semialdehyde dehydrogenase [Candidatus Gastranaerophilales bacterium]
MSLENIAISAKKASYTLASLDEKTKNKALEAIAKALEANKEVIFEANQKDIEQGQKLLIEGKISEAILGRLKLDEPKLRDVIQGFYDVIKLPDPVNKSLSETELDKGLTLKKISCPIGVIGVIFESRPDVIPQIVALAIKSANAVILKGGSEALHTNEALIDVIKTTLESLETFPLGAINLIKTREDVKELLSMEKYVDLIIPRGGNALVKFIKENTKIPVLGHANGICHIYIEESADLKMATDICIDAKTQYPSACNAVETILINKEVKDSFIESLLESMQNAEITIKGDEKIQTLGTNIEPATEDDWKTEYSAKIVSIKIVNDIIEAIDHINEYGSGHTDCIITKDKFQAKIFMDLVDSAGVYHNASTRFADGFRYGLGAEVGISTNKTHARGPVGLEGLTIYKYKMFGNGQIVATYTGDKAKKFTHKKLV